MKNAQVFQSLDTDADETQYIEELTNRSQTLIFRKFFSLYLKLTLLKVWPIVLFVASIALPLILLASKEEPFNRDKDLIYYDPVSARSFDMGFLYVTRLLKDTFFEVQNVIYPKNAEACTIYERYLEGLTGESVLELINSSEEFKQIYDTNLSLNNLYDLTRINDAVPIVDLYYKSDYREHFERAHRFFSQLMMQLNNNIEIYINPSSIKKTVVFNGIAQTACLLMSISAVLVFLQSFSLIVEMQENRVFLLLKISGAREYVLWIATIIPELVKIVLYTLIVTIELKQLKPYKMHSFSLIFVTILISMFALYFMMLAFVPIIQRGSGYKWFAMFFILLSLVFAAVPYAIPEDKSPGGAFYYCSYFFPQDGIAMLYFNMDNCKTWDHHFDWKTINSGRWISTKSIIVSGIITIIMYILLFLFFVLFFPRAAGSPPIGFKNIFSAAHWKRLLTKQKGVELGNMSAPLIKVNHLEKTYRGNTIVHALDDVSFSVDQKEIIVLIGPNGCGKSTLLNTMTGVIDCNGGELELYGSKSSTGFSAMQDCIGIAFQDNVIIEKLSVHDHLKFFGQIRGTSDSVIDGEISALAQSLEMEEILPMKAISLSGGQKRKLCIAIAFIGSPPVVILDEPTAGIDVTTRQIIWRAISMFKDTTCFVTSHSLEEAENVSSRLFVMKSGQLIFTGTSSQLRRDYHCGYRVSAIGEETDIDGFFNFCKKYFPEAEKDAEKPDSILLPVNDNIATFFEDLEMKKSEFQISDFIVSAEQLEHVILRLINY